MFYQTWMEPPPAQTRVGKKSSKKHTRDWPLSVHQQCRARISSHPQQLLVATGPESNSTFSVPTQSAVDCGLHLIWVSSKAYEHGAHEPLGCFFMVLCVVCDIQFLYLISRNLSIFTSWWALVVNRPLFLDWRITSIETGMYNAIGKVNCPLKFNMIGLISKAYQQMRIRNWT